ncbi:flavin reductase family protein [Streptomyces nanshensis]|uniref:flavin reductase family protein n=1 Tax=Streptomyces nanshensis TaxID=518642 RepID=UPI001FD41194|nr:flavin reductase family protein [Streptomyces nanshensis]
MTSGTEEGALRVEALPDAGDEQALREGLFEVMAAFPTGVGIVTTTDEEGRPAGLTTSALCSVSASPPMLLVCVGNQSRTLPHLLARRRFVVHVMAAGAGRAACVRFASKSWDKFAGLDWRRTPSGLPLLERGVLAWAECVTAQEVATGDHTTLVGRYVAGEGAPEGRHPLLYHQRDYRDLSPGPATT